MDHLEAVVELKNIISEKTINKLIPLLDQKCSKHLSVGNDIKDLSIRNVMGYHLKNNIPTDIFYFNFINNEIKRAYSLYKTKFPLLETTLINQIDLLKYSKGGKYDTHVDANKNMNRKISIIINLNENYEGGDLVFTDQKGNIIKKIKLGTGSVVFFPSNFMYPHSIEPIRKGIRYSIVAWLQ